MQNAKFYEVLGVEKTSSDDAIRRAYRQLALRYHPDKAGPAGAEKFKEVQEAYATLSDPHKRQLYDLYGEDGMKIFDNDFMADKSYLFTDPRVAIAIFLLVGTVTVLILLFPVLLAVKVDTYATWSWFVVFIPVYIGELFILSTCCISVYVKNAETGQRLCERRTAFYFLLMTAFTVFLSCGLQGIMTNWTIIFSPLFAAEFISLLRLPYALSRVGFEASSRARKETEAMMGMEQTPDEKYYHFVLQSLISALWFPLLAIFIVLKLDDILPMSWAVVFLPVWTCISLGFVDGLYKTWVSSDNLFPNVACSACVLGTATGLIVGFIVMIVMKLTAIERGEEGIKLGKLFIPIFIVFGLLSCCFCVCMPVLLRNVNGTDHQQFDEERGDVPVHSAPHHPTGEYGTNISSTEQPPSSTSNDID
jgi:hypothetical protein